MDATIGTKDGQRIPKLFKLSAGRDTSTSTTPFFTELTSKLQTMSRELKNGLKSTIDRTRIKNGLKSTNFRTGIRSRHRKARRRHSRFKKGLRKSMKHAKEKLSTLSLPLPMASPWNKIRAKIREFVDMVKETSFNLNFNVSVNRPVT